MNADWARERSEGDGAANLRIDGNEVGYVFGRTRSDVDENLRRLGWCRSSAWVGRRGTGKASFRKV